MRALKFVQVSLCPLAPGAGLRRGASQLLSGTTTTSGAGGLLLLLCFDLAQGVENFTGGRGERIVVLGHAVEVKSLLCVCVCVGGGSNRSRRMPERGLIP